LPKKHEAIKEEIPVLKKAIFIPQDEFDSDILIFQNYNNEKPKVIGSYSDELSDDSSESSFEFIPHEKR